ncbi:hypothetical protein AB0B25_17385 [Nocardia sp. NPDC049190]|uniref:hypothetical protein n=1 Tax=Nocardia sp. NPDC049190 TaxID=3155650 RepID=UPI0033DFD225
MAESDRAVESALFDAESAGVVAHDAKLSALQQMIDWLDVKIRSVEQPDFADARTVENLLDEMWREVGEAFTRAADVYNETADVWTAAGERVRQRNDRKMQLLQNFTAFVDDVTAGSSGNPSWVQALTQAESIERAIATREASYCAERVLDAHLTATALVAERVRGILMRTVFEQHDRGELSVAPDDLFGRICADLRDDIRTAHEIDDITAQTELMLAFEAYRAQEEIFAKHSFQASRESELLRRVVDELQAHVWPSELAVAAVMATDLYLAYLMNPFPADLRPGGAALTSVLADRFADSDEIRAFDRNRRALDPQTPESAGEPGGREIDNIGRSPDPEGPARAHTGVPAESRGKNSDAGDESDSSLRQGKPEVEAGGRHRTPDSGAEGAEEHSPTVRHVEAPVQARVAELARAKIDAEVNWATRMALLTPREVRRLADNVVYLERADNVHPAKLIIAAGHGAHLDTLRAVVAADPAVFARLDANGGGIDYYLIEPDGTAWYLDRTVVEPYRQPAEGDRRYRLLAESLAVRDHDRAETASRPDLEREQQTLYQPTEGTPGQPIRDEHAASQQPAVVTEVAEPPRVIDARLLADLDSAQLRQRHADATRRRDAAAARLRELVGEVPDAPVPGGDHDEAGDQHMTAALETRRDLLRAVTSAAELRDLDRELSAAVVPEHYLSPGEHGIDRPTPHVSVADEVIVVAMDGFHGVALHELRTTASTVWEGIVNGSYSVRYLRVHLDGSTTPLASDVVDLDSIEAAWGGDIIDVSPLRAELAVVEQRIADLEHHQAVQELAMVADLLGARSAAPIVEDLLRDEPAGVRRTAQVVEFSGEPRRLVVVAEPGQHLRALTAAEIAHRDLGDALWRSDIQIEYWEIGVQPDGTERAHQVPAARAEGQYRAPTHDEVHAVLLEFYTSWADRISMTFDQWFRLLDAGPFGDGDPTGAVDVDALTEFGHRMSVDSPLLPPWHPAEVLSRLHTRQIPLPPLGDHTELSGRPADLTVHQPEPGDAPTRGIDTDPRNAGRRSDPDGAEQQPISSHYTASSQPDGTAEPPVSPRQPPRLSLADRLRAAEAAHEPVVLEVFRDGTQLPEYQAERVDLVAYGDDFVVVRKFVTQPHHPDAEDLGAMVIRALGGKAPEVHVRENVVYLEYIERPTLSRFHHVLRNDTVLVTLYGDSAAGRRLGFSDHLLGIFDRRGDNVMVDGTAIDNSQAFRDPEGDQHFAARAVGMLTLFGIQWLDPRTPLPNLDPMRGALERLRPEFDRRGRSDWHDVMMTRFDRIIDDAVDQGRARLANEALRAQQRDAIAATLARLPLDSRPDADTTLSDPEDTLHRLRSAGVSADLLADIDGAATGYQKVDARIHTDDDESSRRMRLLAAAQARAIIRARTDRVLGDPEPLVRPVGDPLDGMHLRDDANCGPLAMMAVNDWYRGIRGERAVVVPDMPLDLSGMPVTALSWLAGGRREYFGAGSTGHTEVAARLLDLSAGDRHDEVPRRKQKAKEGHGMIVIDTHADTGSLTSAHAYFVVNHQGVLLTFDYGGRFVGEFDPDRPPVTLRAVHGIEFDADGNPVRPIVAELDAESPQPEPGRPRGHEVGDIGRAPDPEHTPPHQEHDENRSAPSADDPNQSTDEMLQGPTRADDDPIVIGTDDGGRTGADSVYSRRLPDGWMVSDTFPSGLRRPSDEAVQLFQEILDAEQAADRSAQQLRVEAARRIPEDGHRAFAERYVGNERRTAALAAELGITLEELRVRMTEELKRVFNGEIVIRTRAVTLQQILVSGGFKTLFETASSSRIGEYLLEERARLEQAMFGFARDHPVELRPVYARVRTTRGDWRRDAAVAVEHGDVDVVLKSTVAERATACVGDPWGVKAIPSPLTDPQPESFGATPSHHGELGYFGLEGVGRDYAGDRFLDNSSVEVQIHGVPGPDGRIRRVEVTDIDHLVFHRDPPGQRLREMLDEAGIRWSMSSDNRGRWLESGSPGRPRAVAPDAAATAREDDSSIAGRAAADVRMAMTGAADAPREPSRAEFVVRAQGPDPSDERTRGRAGAVAWDWLSETLFDWPADKIDDAGLELAERVVAALANVTDGAVLVVVEETGEPGARRALVTVGDSSFELGETHEFPQWLADAIAPVRHVRLNVPGGFAIAVSYRHIAQIAEALAPYGASAGPREVVQDNIDHGLRHRSTRNRSRLHHFHADVEAEYHQFRFGDSVVELSIYPFRDQAFRDAVRSLDLSGRDDRVVALDEFTTAMVEAWRQRKLAQPQPSAADPDSGDVGSAPEGQVSTDVGAAAARQVAAGAEVQSTAREAAQDHRTTVSRAGERLTEEPNGGRYDGPAPDVPEMFDPRDDRMRAAAPLQEMDLTDPAGDRSAGTPPEQPRYPSPDDAARVEFWDRIERLDPAALSPEAVADAVYQRVPTDEITGLYEGRVSGFKTGEVLRAQLHVAASLDNAWFVSADIANLRGLNNACADRAEANAHYFALAAIFRTAFEKLGAVVVPMRVGGDEMAAVVVGSIDHGIIASAVATVDAQVREYARQHNLSDVPHPKHPGQPEYNGVGLHIGYTEILPGLAVGDIFDAADLGVDRSKRRRVDVAGEPGRAAGADGSDSGAEAAAHRGAGTRPRQETAGSDGEAAGRAGAEGEPGHPLSGHVRYPQPEEVKHARFMNEVARIGYADPTAFVALYEPLRKDEVTRFYEGHGSGFVTGELARARRWVADTGESGFFVSAHLINLSGLNQYAQNRSEVANGHYRAVAEIFRTVFEATGARVVPMRTGGDRVAAVVVGTIDAATMDAAIAAIDSRIGTYTRHEALADIANPSNPEQPGVHLRLGYVDIAAHDGIGDIMLAAERRVFGHDDPPAGTVAPHSRSPATPESRDIGGGGRHDVAGIDDGEPTVPSNEAERTPRGPDKNLDAGLPEWSRPELVGEARRNPARAGGALTFEAGVAGELAEQPQLRAIGTAAFGDQGGPAVPDDVGAAGEGEVVSGSLTVVSAVPHHELTAAFTRYGDTDDGGWTGGDSTYSQQLPDGSRVWRFSDTFLGPVSPEGSRPSDVPIVSNSFVVDHHGTMFTVLGGTNDQPTAVVPPHDNEFYWVGGGHVTENTLDVMFMRFTDLQIFDAGGDFDAADFEAARLRAALTSGGFEWELRENVLVQFDITDLRMIGATSMPSATGIHWASWVEFDGSHTYVHGVEDLGATKYMHVARVLGNDLRAPWEFFTGRDDQRARWSPREIDSARVMAGVSNEYSVTRWNGRYLLITHDTTHPFAAEILVYESTSPTGPFTSPTVLYRAPEAGILGSYRDPNVIIYNAHEHPELRRGNTLVISYNVNSVDVPGVLADVSKYRPRFIEVELNDGTTNDAGPPRSPSAPAEPDPQVAVTDVDSTAATREFDDHAVTDVDGTANVNQVGEQPWQGSPEQPMADTPGWRRYRMQDEVELARDLYNRPESRAAAVAMLDRIRYMNSRLFPDKSPKEIDAAFYANTMPRWGGMVLPTVSLDELRRDGNLREIMAAVLNARFRNSITDNASGTTFSEGIARLLNQPGWEARAGELGLDVATLGVLRETISSAHPGREITAAAVNNEGNLGRSRAADARLLDEYEQSRAARRDRTPAEKRRKNFTVQDWDLLGMPLSRRELEAIPGELEVLRIDKLEHGYELPRDANGRVDTDALEARIRFEDTSVEYTLPIYTYDQNGRRIRDDDGSCIVDRVELYRRVGTIDSEKALLLDPTHFVVPLPWEPGAIFVDFDPGSEYFRQIAVERGIPVTAAFSGSAARMMHTFRLLQPVDVSERDYIAATMAILIPHHHSLFETVQGMRAVGYPVVSESAVSDRGVEGLYQAVDDAVRRRNECLTHVARTVWALGNDDGRIPQRGERDWRALEAAINAQLKKVLPRPGAGDPMTSVVEAVRAGQDGADTAVVVVDDGVKAHGYVVTNVGGTIFVSDTLIESPIDVPRVRAYDNGDDSWIPPYHRVEEAFVAYLANDGGVLSALHAPTFDRSDRDLPHHDIEGPPNDRDRRDDDHPEASEPERFRQWYRIRASIDGPHQSLAQYAEMHSLTLTQLHRWLAEAGIVDASVDTGAPVVRPTGPEDAPGWA